MASVDNPRVAVSRDPSVPADAKVARALELYDWHPPRGLERVLLKPNFIKHAHLLRDEHRQVITQREVIRPVVEWVAGWAGDAEIAFADAPDAAADISAILERSGASEALAGATAASGREFRFEDLRLMRYNARHGVPIDRITLPGDSRGTTRVDLGTRSCFNGLQGRRYYGADYDIDETNRHHSGDVQEYMFSTTALEADLVVNMPKMKTHKKAGVTLNLKNLVGLNGNKNWLPHHSIGTPRSGGDAYPDDALIRRAEGAMLNWLKPRVRRNRLLSRAMSLGRARGARIFGDTQSVVRSGNWWGNDTIWRMILDLNRVLLYGLPDGTVEPTPQRSVFSVVDGIVAGEGNGPEAPDPVDAGVVAVGESFAAVDLVCAKLMGFDWRRIPHLAHVFDPHDLPLARFGYEDIEVVSDYGPWNGRLADVAPEECMAFRPHFAWKGHVELRAASA